MRRLIKEWLGTERQTIVREPISHLPYSYILLWCFTLTFYCDKSYSLQILTSQQWHISPHKLLSLAWKEQRQLWVGSAPACQPEDPWFYFPLSNFCFLGRTVTTIKSASRAGRLGFLWENQWNHDSCCHPYLTILQRPTDVKALPLHRTWFNFNFTTAYHFLSYGT